MTLINYDMAANMSNAAALADKVALLKRNVLAAPFHHVFALAREQKIMDKALEIPYRKDESFFLRTTKEGGVVVVFQMRFKEGNDLIIADVFMKEFREARRDHSLGQAPAVSFHKTKPLELEGVNVSQGDEVGFVSFALFPSHFTGEKAEKTITSLSTFRNFLVYHIKCAKAYMHIRMRKRVDNTLQLLNRAKPDPVGAVEKKTAQGKTFVRA